jgi:hypothetical protein
MSKYPNFIPFVRPRARAGTSFLVNDRSRVVAQNPGSQPARQIPGGAAAHSSDCSAPPRVREGRL